MRIPDDDISILWKSMASEQIGLSFDAEEFETIW
jgi:hypothetical protein